METNNDAGSARPPSSGWKLVFYVFVIPLSLVFLAEWLLNR
jgi:hypothetical protein